MRCDFHLRRRIGLVFRIYDTETYLSVRQRHTDHEGLRVPSEGSDEYIFWEVLDSLDVGNLGVALPRLEFVDRERTCRSRNAKVGASDMRQEMYVQDSRWCGQRLDDVAAPG